MPIHQKGPLPTTTDELDAAGVAEMFRDRIWSLHGLPERTYSDRGPQFNAKFLTKLYSLLGIEPRFSTAYHPQTDGQSERANQSIEQYLRIYTSHRQDDWDKWLSLGEFAYNNTKNSSIGMTPFQADLGRIPSYAPKLFNKQRVEVPASADWVKKKQQAEEEIQAALRMAADEHKRYYDQKTTEDVPYEPGEKVWLTRKDTLTGKEAITTTRPSQKLEHRRFGPYEVLERVGDKAYKLKLPKTMKIHPVFHVSQLAKYKEDPIPGRTTLPPPLVVVEGEEEYEVNKIEDSRWIGKTFKYLVSWKGYRPQENSWITRRQATNMGDLITEFHVQNPGAPHPDKPAQPTRHRP